MCCILPGALVALSKELILPIPAGTNSSPTPQRLASNLQPLLSGDDLALRAALPRMQHCMLGGWPSGACVKSDQQHSCLLFACDLYLQQCMKVCLHRKRWTILAVTADVHGQPVSVDAKF